MADCCVNACCKFARDDCRRNETMLKRIQSIALLLDPVGKTLARLGVVALK